MGIVERGDLVNEMAGPHVHLSGLAGLGIEIAVDRPALLRNLAERVASVAYLSPELRGAARSRKAAPDADDRHALGTKRRTRREREGAIGTARGRGLGRQRRKCRSGLRRRGEVLRERIDRGVIEERCRRDVDPKLPHEARRQLHGHERVEPHLEEAQVGVHRLGIRQAEHRCQLCSKVLRETNHRGLVWIAGTPGKRRTGRGDRSLHDLTVRLVIA